MDLVFIYLFYFLKKEKYAFVACVAIIPLFSYSIIYIVLFYRRDIKDGYVILVNNLAKNFNINVMQSINIYDARKFHSL